MENYNVLCEIGKGACGAVFLARHQESKKLYALKKIQLDESRKTRTKEAVLREARILSELRHPQIVAFQESFFDENQEYLCIIQDYCDGGTLDDQIKAAAQRNEYIQEKQIVHWFLQISLAVRYMHSKRVLHRDLKTQNIFLDKSGTLCKLGDFGIAKNLDHTIEVASTCVGTPCYLSPEMCQDIPYSSKADVWALGCMLYEMLALKPAFDANNLVSLFYKIVKGEYDHIPEVYSDSMHELVATILTKSPDNRPSARGILALPFVREELLKFVEEKEFLLEQIRLPTRQGSRPYSTPTLSRVAGSGQTDPDGNCTILLPDPQKRALSCRPLLVGRGKEKSLLASAKHGRNGHDIGTIPEETEEQLLEKSLRLERGEIPLIPNVNIAAKLSKVDRESPLHCDSKILDSPRTERAKVNRDKDAQRENRMDVQSCSGAESTSNGHVTLCTQSKMPKVVTAPPNQAIDREARNKSRSPEHKKHKQDHRRSNKQEDKLTDSERIHDKKDKEKKNKLAKEGASVPKLSEPPKGLDSPRTQHKTSKNSSLPKLPKLALDCGDQEPPKRNKVQETVRTPRIQEPIRTPRIVEPNPLVVQVEKQQEKSSQEKHKVPKAQHPQQQQQQQQQQQHAKQHPPSQQHLKPILRASKKKKSNEQRQRKSSDKGLTTAPSENPGRRKSSKKLHRRDERPDTQDSLLSVPFEPGLVDYYSDDFDESSGSETEEDRLSYPHSMTEDIPEDIPDLSRARSLSFSQTLELDWEEDFDIPEIEEDLPYGLEADDDDDTMIAEYGGQEDLDDVVMVAREACDDLSSGRDGDDDTIVDERDRRPSTSKLIKKHCIDALGKEKYERVRRYWENNEEPEMRKLEKMVGKEHAKTIYLMKEISHKALKK